jgi:GH15 family glucan-1,4-alpha-glucosidase
MLLEELGLIGNCQYSALVSRGGDIVWCCLPRFDSEPVFASLLDDSGGAFSVRPADSSAGVLRYIENTNILETRFHVQDGSFRVIDFAPRFHHHDRTFRPTMLVRIIEPIDGTPRITVRCDPVLGWSRKKPRSNIGSNHVEYYGFETDFRLLTDVPLSYLGDTSFALTTRKHLVLNWGPPVVDEIAPMCDRFLGETTRYWTRWVKHCNLPPLYQQEVIRSALALKLHCFDDTGAIVAAMTTSLPEAAGSGRNWDYRYCWLRDAYYSVGAFRSLGHFEEREQFLNFLLNVASSSPSLDLAPLYRVDGSRELQESELPEWNGFEGNGPVRVGNAAVNQVQGDVYGELVLALTPLFLDARFLHEQTRATLDLLTRLARKAIAVAGVPDSGIWEVRRTLPAAQTFGSIMSWAAADRMIEIAVRHAPDLADEFRNAASRIRDEIMREAWSPSLNSLAGSYGGNDLDAAVLHAITLRLLQKEDARADATVDAVMRDLREDGWLYRYKTDDGFGKPTNAFVICSFWLVEALSFLGRMDEAREIFEHILDALPKHGLLSEDYDPREKRFWGNFPQAYSHVGLIRAAFAASPPWSQVW